MLYYFILFFKHFVICIYHSLLITDSHLKKIFALILHYIYKIKTSALGKKVSVSINRGGIQTIRTKYYRIE